MLWLFTIHPSNRKIAEEKSHYLGPFAWMSGHFMLLFSMLFCWLNEASFIRWQTGWIRSDDSTVDINNNNNSKTHTHTTNACEESMMKRWIMCDNALNYLWMDTEWGFVWLKVDTTRSRGTLSNSEISINSIQPNCMCKQKRSAKITKMEVREREQCECVWWWWTRNR